jgi:hypothetical protein
MNLSSFCRSLTLTHFSSGLLEEELEESQCEVRVREEEVILLDVKLRAGVLNGLLPA